MSVIKPRILLFLISYVFCLLLVAFHVSCSFCVKALGPPWFLCQYERRLVHLHNCCSVSSFFAEHVYMLFGHCIL